MSDKPPLSSPEPVPSGTTNLQGLHVLLVEDNPDNQFIAVGLLEHAGVQVDVVAEGGAALDRLTHHAYDAVLLDLMMEGMDGLETLQAIRGNPVLNPMPVIVMTADVTASARKQCEVIGINGFVTKPIEASILYQALAQLGLQAKKPLAGLRILLADDEPMNQMIACEILRSSGAEVVAAQDGEAALQALDEQTFDMVLLDIFMPKLSGPEAAVLMRQHANGQHLCILAMSASDDLNDRQACVAAGMNGYVAKPLDVTQVRALWASCNV